MRSKSWNDIEDKSDPAELMNLIQKACLHGGDTAYIPDRFLASLKDLIARKQGT